MAQVVLAMQLPFTLIPLIKATSSRSIMGSFASTWITSMTAWAASAAVSIANVLMILDMLWKEASHSASDQSENPSQDGFVEWLHLALMSMMQYAPVFVSNLLGGCRCSVGFVFRFVYLHFQRRRAGCDRATLYMAT